MRRFGRENSVTRVTIGRFVLLILVQDSEVDIRGIVGIPVYLADKRLEASAKMRLGRMSGEFESECGGSLQGESFLKNRLCCSHWRRAYTVNPWDSVAIGGSFRTRCIRQKKNYDYNRKIYALIHRQSVLHIFSVRSIEVQLNFPTSTLFGRIDHAGVEGPRINVQTHRALIKGSRIYHAMHGIRRIDCARL